MKTADFKGLMMKKLFLMCLLSLVSLPAFAEQFPTFTLDKRIQQFSYTDQDVFAIKVKYGHGVTIQLEKGEFIHDDGALGVGEKNDWSIGVKGNHILFKPLKPYIEPSNMVVVTNKRTYVFSLKTTAGNDMTYLARFSYPENTLGAIESQTQKPRPTVYQRIKQGDISYLIDARINTAYVKRGNLELTPTAMWDDGLFTYLQYDNAKELPSIYKVMPDGTESVVNTHIDNDKVVIHEVNHLYRLRLGKAVAELGNQAIRDSGFNRTGTSRPDVVRIEQ